MNGEAKDRSTVFVPMGSADIFFPTDFHLVRELYRESARRCRKAPAFATSEHKVSLTSMQMICLATSGAFCAEMDVPCLVCRTLSLKQESFSRHLPLILRTQPLKMGSTLCLMTIKTPHFLSLLLHHNIIPIPGDIVLKIQKGG